MFDIVAVTPGLCESKLTAAAVPCEGERCKLSSGVFDTQFFSGVFVPLGFFSPLLICVPV